MKLSKTTWIAAIAALMTVNVSAAEQSNTREKSAKCPTFCKGNLEQDLRFCEDEEECEEEHEFEEEDFKPMDEKEIRTWMKKNAPWATKGFDEEIQEFPDDRREVLMDFSGMIYEYEELKEENPKLAKLMIEVHKIEFDIDEMLDTLEANGEDQEDRIRAAIKPLAKKLATKSLALEKGYLKMEIEALKKELEEIEEAEANADEIAEDFLDELLGGDEEDWDEEEGEDEEGEDEEDGEDDEEDEGEDL